MRGGIRDLCLSGPLFFGCSHFFVLIHEFRVLLWISCERETEHESRGIGLSGETFSFPC